MERVDVLIRQSSVDCSKVTMKSVPGKIVIIAQNANH